MLLIYYRFCEGGEYATVFVSMATIVTTTASQQEQEAWYDCANKNNMNKYVGIPLTSSINKNKTITTTIAIATIVYNNNNSNLRQTI